MSDRESSKSAPPKSRSFARHGNRFAIGLLLGVSLSLADFYSQMSRTSKASAAATTVGAEIAGFANGAPKTWLDWKRVLSHGIREFSADQIPSVAASVTFYGLLALFPGLAAFVSLYGLFANVNDARGQIDSLSDLLPSGAISILNEQLTRLTSTNHGALGLAFAISLLVSLWSSNAGVKALIAGLNIAYEKKEQRGFVRLNLLSLGFTVGGLALAILGVSIMVAAPAAGRDGIGVVADGVLRWVIMLLVTIGLLSLIYRFAPCRDSVRWRWITPGSCMAAVGWMGMSLLFSWYVANFGHYDRTYGSLGAVVGFMTWMWLSLMVVLFGAELNSAIEHGAHSR